MKIVHPINYVRVGVAMQFATLTRIISTTGNKPRSKFKYNNTSLRHYGIKFSVTNESFNMHK